MGKFLIKGKRLNKLESIFAPDVTAAEDTDVTEEEESNDEDEDEQKTKVGGVCVAPRKTSLPSADFSFGRAFTFLLMCRRKRS